MTKVFKTTLLIFFIASIHSLSAQKVAFQVGYTNPARQGNGLRTTYLNGTQVGLTIGFDLKKNLSLLTGANYTVAYGQTTQYYPSSDKVGYYSFGHFADIPLRLQWTLNLSKTLKFMFYGGPNINYGISQKQLIISNLKDINGDYDIYKKTEDGLTGLQKGNDINGYKIQVESNINRFNIQMGAGGGIQWKHLQLKAGYDWGLNNLDLTKDKKIKQNNWYISLAYEL